MHILFNRVDNDGRIISDRNDRYRSERFCKELTARHELYFAAGKEHVKEHRLREPERRNTRYTKHCTTPYPAAATGQS